MAWQRPINVQATPTEERGPTIAELGGWRTVDCSMGYLVDEVILGQKLSVAVGLTNLSELTLTLHFETAQRIGLEVRNKAGDVIYKTPTDPTPLPSDESLAPTDGRYWTESFLLDAALFVPGQEYVIIGYLLSKNLPSSTALPLPIPVSQRERKR